MPRQGYIFGIYFNFGTDGIQNKILEDFKVALIETYMLTAGNQSDVSSKSDEQLEIFQNLIIQVKKEIDTTRLKNLLTNLEKYIETNEKIVKRLKILRSKDERTIDTGNIKPTNGNIDYGTFINKSQDDSEKLIPGKELREPEVKIEKYEISGIAVLENGWIMRRARFVMEARSSRSKSSQSDSYYKKSYEGSLIIAKAEYMLSKHPNFEWISVKVSFTGIRNVNGQSVSKQEDISKYYEDGYFVCTKGVSTTYDKKKGKTVVRYGSNGAYVYYYPAYRTPQLVVGFDRRFHRKNVGKPAFYLYKGVTQDEYIRLLFRMGSTGSIGESMYIEEYVDAIEANVNGTYTAKKPNRESVKYEKIQKTQGGTPKKAFYRMNTGIQQYIRTINAHFDHDYPNSERMSVSMEDIEYDKRNFLGVYREAISNPNTSDRDRALYTKQLENYEDLQSSMSKKTIDKNESAKKLGEDVEKYYDQLLSFYYKEEKK